MRMSLPKRAAKNGRKFLNPVPTTVGGFTAFFKVLPRLFANTKGRTPQTPIGPFRTDASVYARPPVGGLRVTWFGHSGLLLEIDGVRVLVDPIWERCASPLQWAGPKRFFAPTMRLEEMPPLDAVLISHDHYDHLGAHTVRKLAGLPATANARWITSLGVGRRLQKMGVPEGRITELDWTESVDVAGALPGSSLKVTAWPARHFSGRGLLDRYTTLWSSFVLEGPRHRVYFGADSGWWDGLAEIAAQYDGFDLILLEIGAFDPAWASIHLGPDNAARAFEAMGGARKAGLLMPIHWGLFSLGLHAWRQPMERLEAVARERGIPLWSPVPGIPTEVAGPGVARWWKAGIRSAIEEGGRTLRDTPPLTSA
jgi:L-ascorbate metabolism protein UlaG (beta-lactamase superfamily)